MLTGLIYKNKKFASFAGEFLKNSDTGIDSLKVDVIDSKSVRVPLEILKKITEMITTDKTKNAVSLNSDAGDQCIFEKNEKGELVCKSIKSIHPRKDGSAIEFDFSEESDGTQRVLQLLPPLFKLNSENESRVYVIDEIDSSLHPLLVWKFLEFFLGNCNGGQSQLIVTTHETHLLNLDLLRRDEIWFVEKKDGQTKLYSLADFKIRTDLVVQKGYLNGRFGAIPFLGDFSKLCPADKADSQSEKKGAGNGSHQ
jgi:AAA15 family ATPase/GTPase